MTGAEWIFIGFAFACSFLFNKPAEKKKEKTKEEEFADLIKHFMTEGIPVKIKGASECEKAEKPS
ncbi:hypothetical protein HPC62_14515 [Thermoleptolyngbya sichuanensis A183]|uniref:Uncharacterized protein n=1 Tax=Thermoleptolyngbya sichuanensis A183 TaxID=2737172 RepID=A0A6M8BEH9_9CYAN|nr:MULTISPECIES: hypothetical protein [Thermoleptolyngbya]QKD83247.1 hypothetical protein HPC62_14515 [Thermoleptolyngbya sichuanensis A183]